MARTKRVWKASERESVLDMIQAKRSQAHIAKILSTTVPTLKRHFKQELAGKARTPGTSKADWTEQEGKAILAMASYGIPYDDIALCFDVTVTTLSNHFGDQLANAATKLKANIARSLVTSALVGRNVAAQIFLAKTRLRWSERVEVAHEGRVETGPSDVDIEAAISQLSPDGREALRTLIRETPKEPQGEKTQKSETLH